MDKISHEVARRPADHVVVQGLDLDCQPHDRIRELDGDKQVLVGLKPENPTLSVRIEVSPCASLDRQTLGDAWGAISSVPVCRLTGQEASM